MLQITYILHDGFAVRTPVCNLLFDYWRGEGASRRRRDGVRETDDAGLPPLLAEALDLSKPLYVFISHFHKDHYDPVVFGWTGLFPEVRYVVSRDVMIRMRHILSPGSVYNGPRPAPDRVTCLRPGQTFDDGLARISAFPSTDVGNCYAVEVSGTSFFHAGDLNAWIWKDESSDMEVRKALDDYAGCLDRIAEAGFKRFDHVFFPVDSRIGSEWFTGARIFVRRFAVGHFFPMHFGLGSPAEREARRRDAFRFGLYMNPEHGEYIGLGEPGDRFVSSDA